MAFFAAVTAALAFFAIGFIPKSEPSLVVAIWFHAVSLASSVLPLVVRSSLRLLPQEVHSSGLTASLQQLSAGPHSSRSPLVLPLARLESCRTALCQHSHTIFMHGI